MSETSPQFPVPVYLINLDRSPERLAHAAAELAKCGAPFTRISAIDGRQLGPLPWPNFDDASYRRRHGKHPAPGEWGCYMSHVLTIRTFLENSTAPAALILEDDVVLPADLGPLIAEILLQAPEWDMVKLAANRPGYLVGATPVGPHHRMGISLRPTACSGAYLLNRRAAARYLEKLLPMTLPFDQEFDLAWRFGIRVCVLDPLPISQDTRELPTTIRGMRKLPWYKRTSVLPYRLGKSFRRFAHGLISSRARKAASRPPA